MLKLASKISAAGLLLALAIVAIGQRGTQTPPDKWTPEYQALTKAFSAEQAEYYKPYQTAKTEEESAKIHLDPDKNPAKTYLPKFKDLAKKAKGTNTGFDAWNMVMSLGQQSGSSAASSEAADAIMGGYMKSPKMSQFASMLSYAFYEMKPAERVPKIEKMLTRIERESPNADVKAAALYSHAKLLAETHSDQAGPMFAEVMAKYPNTQFGKAAKMDKFEAENLVPGKPAPEILGTDQNGNPFKLSDYKGKVVVLDFWGFW